MRKILLLLLCFVLVSVPAYSYDFALTSIKTEENTVSVYRGNSIQTVGNENFLISMLATKNNKGIQFSTSITNFSSENYFFDENCISVYEGVYENSNWKKIDYNPATSYLSKEKSAAKSDEIATALLLGLSAASAGYSTVNGSGYVNGHRYTYSANVYSPADAAVAMTNSYIALDNMQQRNQNYISFLEDNLLFSSQINSLDNYNGIFVVNERNGPDYKIVFEMSPSEKFAFYFTRSDKNEILNPWKDKSRSRHSIFAGVSPTFRHFSLYYSWAEPKGVGFYTGFSFQKEGIDIEAIGSVYDISSISGYYLNYPDPLNTGYTTFYNWKFNYDRASLKNDGFGYYGGITVKTIPNTWLLLGIGMDFITSRYYEGDLYYKYTGDTRHPATSYTYYDHSWIEEKVFDILCSPQIGVNVITSNLNIGAMVTFPIGGEISFDISLGYAF